VLLGVVDSVHFVHSVQALVLVLVQDFDFVLVPVQVGFVLGPVLGSVRALVPVGFVLDPVLGSVRALVQVGFVMDPVLGSVRALVQVGFVLDPVLVRALVQVGFEPPSAGVCVCVV
jgi:hypothetical protein